MKWWWSWRNGLEPNATDSKLWFGGGIHQALATWYLLGSQRGPHPAETWVRFTNNEERYIRNNSGLINQDQWVEARELGIAMLDEYVREYGRDEQWDVIATEQQFQALINAEVFEGRKIVYVGTFDGVYRDLSTGKLWLMEHKTASNTPNTGYLELDDQAGSYFMVAENVLRHKGIMAPGEKLEGIMYNFLRKALPDDRPTNAKGQALNKNGSVSKNQPKPLFMRYPAWRNDAQRAKMRTNVINEVQLMLAYRGHQLGLTKTPTHDCQWDCEFFQMCQLHEAGEDWTEFRDAMFHKRDPYSDHRVAMKSA
jgi:hypothetical protein